MLKWTVFASLLAGLTLASCDTRTPNTTTPNQVRAAPPSALDPQRTAVPVQDRTPAHAPMIPYTVIERAELGEIKVSYDLRVDLVDGRLPTNDELEAISRHLYEHERTHERTFVLFYLPGMQPGAGAFATAHHDPVLVVRVLGHMLPEKYKHLLGPP